MCLGSKLYQFSNNFKTQKTQVVDKQTLRCRQSTPQVFRSLMHPRGTTLYKTTRKILHCSKFALYSLHTRFTFILHSLNTRSSFVLRSWHAYCRQIGKSSFFRPTFHSFKNMVTPSKPIECNDQRS